MSKWWQHDTITLGKVMFQFLKLLQCFSTDINGDDMRDLTQELDELVAFMMGEFRDHISVVFLRVTLVRGSVVLVRPQFISKATLKCVSLLQGSSVSSCDTCGSKTIS